MVLTLFANMKTLKLDEPSLGNSLFPPYDWDNASIGSGPELGHDSVCTDMRNVQALLAMAVNAETPILHSRSYKDTRDLVKGYDDNNDGYGGMFDIYDWLTQRKISLPAQLTWSPHLTTLELGDLLCTLQNFNDVMRHCRQSLRHLTSRNLQLVGSGYMPHDTGQKSVKRGCLVALFRWISEDLNLESIGLIGWFQNDGMQGWYIHLGCDDESKIPYVEKLLTRVKQYILHGGVCPLDKFAVKEGYYDLEMPDHDPEVPNSWHRAHCDISDVSFAIEFQDYMEDERESGLDEPEDSEDDSEEENSDDHSESNDEDDQGDAEDEDEEDSGDEDQPMILAGSGRFINWAS